MKEKIGKGIRMLSVLLFIVIITIGFAHTNNLLAFLIITIIVLMLINISQLLSPINLKKNLFLYLALIIYFILTLLWSVNCGFYREFDYNGIKLKYKYSIFNGSYLKLFGEKRYNYKNLDNYASKQKAIDFCLFLQCEIYEEEKNYTEKQKEDIKTGKIIIYHNDKYTKGNLKEFILKEFKRNKVYLESYNYLTKQKNIDIDTITKYRYQIFNINVEE